MGLFDGLYSAMFEHPQVVANRNYEAFTRSLDDQELSETSLKCIAHEKDRWDQIMRAVHEDNANKARRERLDARRAERRAARRAIGRRR